MYRLAVSAPVFFGVPFTVIGTPLPEPNVGIDASHDVESTLHGVLTTKSPSRSSIWNDTLEIAEPLSNRPNICAELLLSMTLPNDSIAGFADSAPMDAYSHTPMKSTMSPPIESRPWNRQRC